MSRNDVRKQIKSKEAYVNGELVTDPAFKADTELDEIVFSGETLHYKEHVYIMLNKPEGVLSAVSDKDCETIIDLLPDSYKKRNMFPCGRLDKDTTGIIILTDDGKLCHDMMSPKKDIYKTYIATLDKEADEEYCKKRFLSGITISDKGESYRCKKAYFEKLSDSDVRIDICEGRFHQVKKMCLELGYIVKSLKRVKIGNLKLDESLCEGEFRELSDDEISMIFS